jgi:hypothetical protein
MVMRSIELRLLSSEGTNNYKLLHILLRKIVTFSVTNGFIPLAPSNNNVFNVKTSCECTLFTVAKVRKPNVRKKKSMPLIVKSA